MSNPYDPTRILENAKSLIPAKPVTALDTEGGHE